MSCANPREARDQHVVVSALVDQCGVLGVTSVADGPGVRVSRHSELLTWEAARWAIALLREQGKSPSSELIAAARYSA